jgi:hypothetical protein
MDTFIDKDATVQDFEREAETLIGVMFSLIEKKLKASGAQPDPAALALAQTAMMILAGIRAFILIDSLKNQ